MKELPTVRVERVIPAPPTAVWDVLIDYPRYPAWNPFTMGVTTTGVVGDPVVLDVRLGGFRLTMHERMRVYEPKQRVGWGLYILGGVLLDCTRIQEIEDAGNGHTRYVCYESFRGWLVPLFFWFCRRPMEEGFEAAAAALERRVAELHPPQGF
jgi:hypothetical protein